MSEFLDSVMVAVMVVEWTLGFVTGLLIATARTKPSSY